MPTNRFQFSDDFVLNNGNVGIGSSVPQEKLDVVDGSVRGEHLKVTGVSSFTSYEGFLNSNQNITESISFTAGTSGSLSGEIIIGTGVTVTVRPVGLGTTTVGVGTTTAANGTITNAVSTTNTVVSGQGSIDSLKVYNTFTVPVGGTADRPSKATPGQLFFNRDFATMEFWDGDRWRQVDNTTQSGRAVFGASGSYQTVNISSTGNSVYFGNAATSTEIRAAFGSEIRGVWGGGYIAPAPVNAIEYVTLASNGNAINFGNLTVGEFRNTGGCSSSTRGLFFAGGHPAYFNTIHYVQISTLGNALDFGDSTIKGAVKTCFSSPTRGFSMGGFPANSPAIDVVTIASTGNAIQFGDMGNRTIAMAGLSNRVRGIFAGGYESPGPTANSNTIEYITMASNGNSIDFGDLTQGRNHPGGTATSTRGIFFGGIVSPTSINTIDYITIASTGNAIDFGDTIASAQRMRGTSDSHGGLGGF